MLTCGIKCLDIYYKSIIKKNLHSIFSLVSGRYLAYIAIEFSHVDDYPKIQQPWVHENILELLKSNVKEMQTSMKNSWVITQQVLTKSCITTFHSLL
jgi:hypothetical protein